MFAAAPLGAQSFDLPPGTEPTSTPDVEGPVDDSGVVPVGPRAIPTATPTPTPAPVATPPVQPIELPTPAATPSARPTTDPRSRFGPAPAQSAPAPEPRSGSAPDEAPLPLENPPTQVTPPATGSPPETRAPAPSQASGSETGMPELGTRKDSNFPWLWLLIAFGIALAIGAGFFALRRRAQSPAPKIEPPIVGDKQPAVSGAKMIKPRFELMLEVERVTRSMMMLSVKYHLVIANRADRAMRDLQVHADLTSAKRGTSEEGQLASVETELPIADTVERIGPNQSRTIKGTLQIPIQDLSIFPHGRHPAVVPLIRVRVSGETVDPVAKTYVVGLPSDAMGARFLPLSLDGPPGGYEGVRAKALA